MRNFFGGNKKKKKKNDSTGDENDLYVPQPVTVQRSWGTKSTVNVNNKQKSKKKAPKNNNNQQQNNSDNNHNNENPSEPPPPPQPQPQPIQHAQTVKNVNNVPSPSQSQPQSQPQSHASQLEHASTQKNIYQSPSKSQSQSQSQLQSQSSHNSGSVKYPNMYQKPTAGGYYHSNNNDNNNNSDNNPQNKHSESKIAAAAAAAYSQSQPEHKSNESIASDVSSYSNASAMSAPAAYHSSSNQPNSLAVNSSYNSISSYPASKAKNTKHKVQYSEGGFGKTGSPEVVGDISDYRQQQKQQQNQHQNQHQNQQQQQQQQPQQRGHNDGVPETSPAPPDNNNNGYPALHQSRTSASGAQFHNNNNNQYYQQQQQQQQQNPQQYQQPQQNAINYDNRPLQSARDDPSAALSSQVAAHAYAPKAPMEESSDSDDLDMISNMLQRPHEPQAQRQQQQPQNSFNMDDAINPNPNPNSNANANANANANQNSAMPNNNQANHSPQQQQQQNAPQHNPHKAADASSASASAAVAVNANDAQQPQKQIKQNAKPAAAVVVEEEEEDDDDCGLADWLVSIGFKKKKLKIMVSALSDMGFDDFDELKEFLVQLYQNSYGQQQKSWMDKMQSDLTQRGIKFAQWISFSQAAKQLIEQQIRQQQNSGHGNENGNGAGNAGGNNNNRKHSNSHNSGVNSFEQSVHPKQMQPQLQARGIVVIQETEQLYLNNLLDAMANTQTSIEQLTSLVLSVQKNERIALESLTKEFSTITTQLEKRKTELENNINNISAEKYKLIDEQIQELRVVDADYQETMAEFNRILQSNDNNNNQNKSKSTSHKNKKLDRSESKRKRSKKIVTMVSAVLHQHARYANVVPVCTPLIGFHCNSSPVLVQFQALGMVSWGNPPPPPIILRIATSDWAIQIQWKSGAAQKANKNNSKKQLVSDPETAYEVQCVTASNEANLLWNFENPRYLYAEHHSQHEQSGHAQSGGKVKYKKNRIGIITKHTSARTCMFTGFVTDVSSYALRIKSRNRNGWSFWSMVAPAKTKKKRKRKTRKLDTVKVCKFRGNNSDGNPRNLFFSNDKLVYQSLTVMDFNMASAVMQRVTGRTIAVVKDWIVFDFERFTELTSIRVKYDQIHSRWGNVPKLIEIEFADYNLAEKDFVYNYKPMTEQEKEVMHSGGGSAGATVDAHESKDTAEDGDDSDDDDESDGDGMSDLLSQMNDGNAPSTKTKSKTKKKKPKATASKKQMLKTSKMAGMFKKNVMQQLHSKRREDEDRYQQLWRMIARIDCKKKSGWQEFGLESIDTYKRRGRFLRLHFVSNFDCNVEQVSKYIVEQIMFVGIQYQMEDYMQ